MNINELNKKKKLRKTRSRAKVMSTQRPRLNVFRSNKHIYVQVIDDMAAITVAAASDREVTQKLTKSEKAMEVGKLIAERAKKAKVTQVCFDRGSYKYAGRIMKLAEAARENGMEF